MKHSAEGGIDIYPVGVLEVLLKLGRSIRSRHPQATKAALIHVRYQARYLRRQAKDGDWRAVRNSFNGYLAEHPARGTRCGHGWTRRRALRDLHGHLAAPQPRVDEEGES